MSVGRRFVGMAVLTVVTAVLAAACSVVPRLPRVPDVTGAANAPCTVAATDSCALPYPTDEFTVADPLSGTGRRIEIPDGLLPAKVADRLGPGATPADAFDGADGFAVLTPVMFELDRAVAPGSLPADGGDVFAVYDESTGERVDIRAEVPIDAARHGGADTIVVAWPRVRYEYGHTYVARITTGLRPAAGGVLPRAAGLEDSSDGWAAELRESLESVEPGGWDRVVSATRFTVRSAGNATAELDGMAAIAAAEDHPIRNVRFGPPLLVDHASAVVTGEVRISDFRDEHGVARVANGSTGRWVKFLLALPEQPAGVEGAPVVIYGHGLTVNKETMFGSASLNAERGLATIGIDVPNHGSRQGIDDRGYLLDQTSPRRFGRLASMPLQGIVDHVSLLSAVQHHLGELDLTLPPSLVTTNAATPIRLDTDRVLYVGTSMGSVLGGAFAALATDLDGAFLQVGGTGIADIIYHSLLWPLFMPLVPDTASTGDAYALMGAATMLMDRSDNVNVIERARDGGTPVFLAYGIGDGIVPNFASERMIGLLDLALVGPQLRSTTVPVRQSGSQVPPSDGRGVAQVWSSAPVELQSFGAHLSFAEPRADHLLEQWLDARLAALGVVAPE